jgi:hypothetical protein
MGELLKMPAIEVSCPVCSTNNVIEMRLMEPRKGGLTDLLFGIVSDIGIKHYAFAGEGYDDYIDHPDADLIANAPADIQALLEYIEELEGKVNNE